MKTIAIHNGRFTIPKEFEISEQKRKLHIRTPWVSRVQRLSKDNWTVQSQMWMRHKDLGDKPYIPEGFIEIDGQKFKAVKVGDKRD